MTTCPTRGGKTLGLLAALSLAGCGPAPTTKPDSADPAPVARTAGPATRSPTAASPAPGPAPKPAPRPDVPVLTSDGLAPLKVGMTLAQITAALGPDADPQAVGGPEPEQCDQFRPARAPRGVLVMTENNVLTRVSLINDSAVKTDRGVGLGSTTAAVRAAYPQAVATPHKYRDAPSEYLTFWSRKAVNGDQASPSDRGIVFEIDGKGIVDLIHAGGPAIRYVEGCL